jgi:hypothetical protein
MKKTLKSLQEEVAKLKKIGKAYADEVTNRVVARPYHYEINPVDATAGQTPVAKVSELYAHVQTAAKLGYETGLQADDNGRLQVVFFKKIPNTPFDFLF